MFLSLLRRRNPEFLAAAATLHQTGEVPANSTVLDLDAMAHNVQALSAEAQRLGLTVFAMTKQIGRNPDACRVISANGIPAAVGVDIDCAIAAAAGGLRVGHLGHLVQVPRARASEGAILRPDFWTVFSLDKALETAASAVAAGYVQNVLVRISREGDRFYRGHEGGVPAEDIVKVADAIDEIDGLRFAGVTTFPAALFNVDSNSVQATPNLTTLEIATNELQRSGRTAIEVNAPGTTSTSTLQMLANAGATQVEPGHAMTGTTPWHATKDLVELPAVTYVTEISHLWGGEAFIFGGGLYIDPVLGLPPTQALVIPRDADLTEARLVDVEMPKPEAIDYYATFPVTDTALKPGDTVLMGFRPQVFVTRSHTVGISNITGTPVPHAVWSADGSRPTTAAQAVTRS